MFYRQKGFLPTILFFIGFLIHVIFIGFTLPHTILVLVDIFSEQQFPITLLSALEFISGMIGLIWSVPLLIGSFFVSAFPEIRIAREGIEYRTYKIICSKLMWHEINGVVDLPKGYKAITISRKGFALVNGLYSNKIFGDFVKSKDPVLLLSPGLENVELLLKEIRSNTEAMD